MNGKNIQKINTETPGISSYIRMPPQDSEAEMSVLGALMLDSNAINQIADILEPDDFYREAHHLIYRAMLELFERHAPIDILSVGSRLKEKQQLENIGGNSYLTELISIVPTASNVKHYAEIIRKKRILRHLIEASSQINQLGYKEEDDLELLLDEAERTIFSIARLSLRDNFQKVKAALEEAWERLDNLHKEKTGIRGVPTGFPDLDNCLSGLQKSDLIILAARPSCGKTSLALDIARNAACNYKIPVGLFSLEMSAQQLVDRLLSAEAHVNSWNLRRGLLSNDDFLRIRDALERLSGASLFIQDKPSLNVLQMRAIARRLQAEHGLGLLIVDYIQLISSRARSDNPVQQMTEISHSLKALAKELEIPVLAISQLSRAIEQRNPPLPRLSDLRESGSIEQDADVVMFIHHPTKHKEDDEHPKSKGHIVEIRIEKHRNGPLGIANLYFNAEQTTFLGIEKGNFNVF
jgi:replicative DNA helicase